MLFDFNCSNDKMRILPARLGVVVRSLSLERFDEEPKDNGQIIANRNSLALSPFAKLRSKNDGRDRSESGSVGNLQVCQV